jgi:proteasome accessory factor A
MWAKMVMGQETEYGFHGPSKVNDELDVPSFSHDLADGMACAHSGSGGIFLANGARFYIDGYHPEYATPECSNPWDLVRYARAGDEHVRRYARRSGGVAVLSNVSYSGRLAEWTTWGSHESYSISCGVQHLVDEGGFWINSLLIPHLASRVVLCGGGGFIKRRGKVEFSLSPRLEHFFGSCFSESTTGDRPLVNLKDEPHGNGGRIHLICGDSLSSDRSLLVRAASTALIVRAVDAMTYRYPGHGGRASWQPSSPIAAMRAFASDPALRAKAQCAGGRLTAIEIQKSLLSALHGCLGEEWMPSWARRAWEVWNEHVKMASSGRATASLDWAIKNAIFRKVHDNAAKVEADSKFGVLGMNGIFRQLDAAGALRCDAGIGGKKAAESLAPCDTRAWKRGQAVKRMHGYRAEKKNRCMVDWEHFVDYHGADDGRLVNQERASEYAPNPCKDGALVVYRIPDPTNPSP